jgi:hypothetical protein
VRRVHVRGHVGNALHQVENRRGRTNRTNRSDRSGCSDRSSFGPFKRTTNHEPRTPKRQPRTAVRVPLADF